MKTLFKAMILGLLPLLAACSTTAKTETATATASSETIANPMTEVSSLEELNEELQAGFTQPGVMGVTDESYAIINTDNGKIGQYEFSVNGMKYTWRFKNTNDEDISGVYVNDGTLFSELDGAGVVTTDEYKGARWLNIDGQYTLVVKDDGEMDAETFTGIAEELENLTNENMYNKNSD